MTIYQLILFAFYASYTEEAPLNKGAEDIAKLIDMSPRKEAIRDQLNTAYDAFFEHRDFARYDAEVRNALGITA